jgi:hypothetical protein
MSVVLKGLPADHSLSKCMGEYVERTERIGGRPSFVGGHCDEMLLLFVTEEFHFEGSCQGWTVHAKEDNLTFFLHAKGTEALPHLAMNTWSVCEQRKDPSSVRVQKFKKRETLLKLSGGQGFGYGGACEGVYRKNGCLHDDTPMYSNDFRAIWFQKGFGWCVGEEMIGTHSCIMHADDFAPTPDAVQSGWIVLIDAVKDPRVQAVLVAAECTPSPPVQQRIPAPKSPSIPDPAETRQELHAAPASVPHPPTVAVVGVGEGLSGLYKELQVQHDLQHMYDGKVMYESTRADGNRVIFYSETCGRRWHIGTCGTDGYMGSILSTVAPASSPHTLGEAVWQEDVMEPCNSVRVTKSKKKNTKVIEVKGVPIEVQGYEALAQANGKYRQQALKIDGRPTFKGGDGGTQAIWYSESTGSWRIGNGNFVGTAAYLVCAKDTASMPNTVKSAWEIVNGLFEPNPYAKIILPTVKAAEEEVPRQMQLKMAEVLAAEQKRCLCCGHQYVLQEEVNFHAKCMHHHCACCEEELFLEEQSFFLGSCAVCAQQEERG